MKSKLLLLDLGICSVWMLSLFGGRHGWLNPAFAFAVMSIFMRFVVSFSLYFRERRLWLPLVMFAVLAVLLGASGDLGVGTMPSYFFIVTHLEYNMAVKKVLGLCFFLWVFVAPFVYALFTLGELKRTDLTWKELVGCVLWNNRLTKTCSAVLAIMLLAFLTGMSMEPHLCQVICLSTVPLAYWLLCHYYRVKPELLWLLVVSMVVFWYAQLLAGTLRASLLLVCFAFVGYVGTRLYKNTQNILISVCTVLYFGILLPSFSIGYNQYACINYARSGFYYLSPFKGILYVKDKTGELYGLRDRYGLLIEPIYEHIGSGVNSPYKWSFEYPMQKDGYTRYYNVLNNEFVNEPDIREDLQHSVREIIERHFIDYGSDYADRGQIKITDLSSGRIVADVRVSMYGNPFLNYYPERFLADDSVEVASGQFFRNDSVAVYDDMLKHSLSYAKNIPDSIPRYRIYVRLATDKSPSESLLRSIAGEVINLKELNL